MLLLKFYFSFIIGVSSFEIKGFQKVENSNSSFQTLRLGRAIMTPYPVLYIHSISLKEITERDTDIKVNIRPR